MPSNGSADTSRARQGVGSRLSSQATKRDKTLGRWDDVKFGEYSPPSYPWLMSCLMGIELFALGCLFNTVA